MSDMGEAFAALREERKQHRRRNLAKADPTGWTQHTAYHWSRTLAGHRLDYWPSANKWQWQGKVMTGDVQQFIAKHEND